MNPLLILIWKHAIVRMRRYFNSPIELLSTVGLLFILYSTKDFLLPSNTHKLHELEVDIPDEYSLDAIKIKSHIFYTPETPISASLMDSIGQKLNIQRRQQFERKRSKFGFSPLMSNLNDTFQDADIIVIQFENLVDSESFPSYLDYTIRSRTNYVLGYKIESYMPMGDMLEPVHVYGDMYQQFLKIQWAIDKSFIEHTGGPVQQKLTLQEFPYPRSAETKKGIAVIYQHVLMILWMSLLICFLFLVTRLVEERTTGIWALTKMIGVSSTTLSISHYINVLPSGLLYSICGAVVCKITPNAITPNTNGFAIFLILILNFSSLMTFAFAFSYLCRSKQYAATMAVTVYIVIYMPLEWMNASKSRNPLTYLYGVVFPHMPLMWFWDNVVAVEKYGKGVTMSNLSTKYANAKFPVLQCYMFYLVQIFVYSFFAWYLEKVLPGQYGQALPFTFIFSKDYWFGSKVAPAKPVSEEEASFVKEEKYFEEPPKNMYAGIKILHVSKEFNKIEALRDVTLDVYKGEITVLLGHNGAGKTTLMSIITGLLSPSAGQVYVNDKEVAREPTAVRKMMGFCPQHNVFYPVLTVSEHVRLYYMLKGFSWKQSKISTRALLEQLGLSAKANSRSSELSGGMMRRLQLGCALAGDANVLILDEPSSGLDVETRRELWDLLLTLRGDRTVLLTTHFMEEADALGDRVAALHAGRLKCHATTMHLKKAIGTGYRITFTTVGPPNEKDITNEIVKHVPEATVKELTLYAISYNLPVNSRTKFPGLFSALEEKKSQLNIDYIGVGIATLEEVFLKLCSNVNVTALDEELVSDGPPKTFEHTTGTALYLLQLKYLLLRQVKYIKSRILLFLCFQVVLPLLTIGLVTHNILVMDLDEKPNSTIHNNTKGLAMDLRMYDDQPWRALYSVNDNNSLKALEDIKEKYPKVMFERTQNVTESLIKYGLKDLIEYNKYIVGVEINDTNAKVMYTTNVRHASPVAVNLASNLLAAQYMPLLKGRTLIGTHNSPLKEREVRFASSNATLDADLENYARLAKMIPWAMIVMFFILSTTASFGSLPSIERISGSRHMHIMSGAPTILYWLTTLVFHFTVTLLTMIVPVLLIMKFLDRNNTIGDAETMLSIFASMCIGITAFLLFTYNVSYCFGERMTIVILVAYNFIFSFIIVMYELSVKTSKSSWVTTVSYIFTPHTLINAVVSSICKYHTGHCVPGYTDAFCLHCKATSDVSIYLIALVVQSVTFMICLLLTSMRVFNGLRDRALNTIRRYKPKPHFYNDELITKEKDYVAHTIGKRHLEITDALLVHDLHKNYPALCRKPVNAVRGVSFSVKKGECFGLLGVNGAGKSTTFKMLTGEECPTRGLIYGDRNYLRNQGQLFINYRYLRSLGYCSQFFGLDQFMTGRENLTLLLVLRGLKEQDVKVEVEDWIKVVGLEKYIDLTVDKYSGGCLRRLGSAAALSSGAPIVLLDEPTAGVDVAARRKIWSALKKALKRNTAVVITSHSMDEMEYLCDRLAIMSAGEVCALGAPGGLRAQHATHLTVMAKLKHTSDDNKAAVDELKAEFHRRFNCTLKDEHRTNLTYQVNETLRYSDIFTQMEDMKISFPIIEDYNISETTLEDVFLSFAKEAAHKPKGV